MATEDNKAQEELLDYEEDEEALVDAKGVGDDSSAGKDGAAAGGAKKGHYVGIHASGFRDFLLKPELLRAVVDCGFEHPSEVQHECIPQAILGVDIVCQAKSGMGKTAVFVLATLHQLNPQPGEVSCLVLCHTRELAWQIAREYERFCKHLPEVKVAVLYGGLPVQKQREMLKNDTPHIVVGCPGRVMQLVREGDLKVDKLQYFVLDECDKMLDQKDMRSQVQEIFFKTPHTKQVMMFSATLSPEVRPICRKFCHEKPMEIYVDDETKLTLHGLQQYYIKLAETEKNRKLNDLLDLLDFNQVVIFCSKVDRAIELDRLLNLCNFPSLVIHSRLKQEERTNRYKQFKNFEKRILVATDLFGRGIDIERVNIVVNYDFPDGDDGSDQYLHRVGRAGRFGTKGLSISFVSTEGDAKKLEELPTKFDLSLYGAHSVRSSVRVSNDFSRIASWRGGAAANSDSKPPLMSTQLGLVRVAGYGIIAGSLCLKTPQIARVWHAKSLVGLAPASIYADVFLFATSVVYHVLKRNPIRAYGESIIVLLQTMVMVGLLWRFGTDENVDAASSSYSSSSSPIAAGAAGAGAVVVDGKADPAANKKKVRGGGLVGKVTIVVGSVAASLLCWQYLPEPMWGLLVIVSTPAILAVQLPQIWKNWRQKHTGELATLTVFLAFLGSTVRIGTTIADLGGDPWLLLNYVLGASSNAVMLTQVYVYRARTAVVREIVDAKAHPAAAAA